MSPYPLIALVVFAMLSLCLWPLLESGRKAIACSAFAVLSVAAASYAGVLVQDHSAVRGAQCVGVDK